MAEILLVEDDIEVRPLLEHIMRTDGHQVVAVESMANAFALLDKRRFDLVVVDVNLPDGSGLNVADRAGQLGIRSLVVTGYGLSLTPGALADYDYLLKPLRAHELLAAIKQRLSQDDGRVIALPKFSTT